MDGDLARRTVAQHITAVGRGDVAAMAADYAEDAVIVRGATRIAGLDAIRAYFAALPARLAGGHVVFADPRPVAAPGATAEPGARAEAGAVGDASAGAEDGRVAFAWRIVGGPGGGTTGTDTCVVRDGRIVEQVVTLDGADF